MICQVFNNLYLGYIYENEHDKGCWTGKKATCAFKPEAFRKTAYYNELKMDMGEDFAEKNIPASFKVYGTAPFCNVFILK